MSRLSFTQKKEAKIQVHETTKDASSSSNGRTVTINVPQLVFNDRLPLQSVDWTNFSHLQCELVYPGGEVPTMIHVPVTEIGGEFYVQITRELLCLD